MVSVLLQLSFNLMCLKLNCIKLPVIFPRKALTCKLLPKFRWYIAASYKQWVKCRYEPEEQQVPSLCSTNQWALTGFTWAWPVSGCMLSFLWDLFWDVLRVNSSSKQIMISFWKKPSKSLKETPRQWNEAHPCLTVLVVNIALLLILNAISQK